MPAGARELAAVLQVAAAGRSGADALRAVAAAYRAYAHAHPGTYAAMQVASDARGQPGRRRGGGGGHRGRPRRLRAGIGDAAIHAVRAVRSALHGFVALEREGGFGIPLSLDDSYATLVEMIDAGLSRRA